MLNWHFIASSFMYKYHCIKCMEQHLSEVPVSRDCNFNKTHPSEIKQMRREIIVECLTVRIALHHVQIALHHVYKTAS